MADDQRKSSEDLIREANRRLRAPQDDGVPDPGPPTSATPTLPDAPRHRETGEAYQAPKEPVPAHFPPNPMTDPSHPAPAVRPAHGSRLLALGLRFGIGIALFAGISFFSSLNDADRDGSGELVSAGDLDVMTLQVGDCFDDPEELDEVVFDVAAVPCSEAHDNEVYSLVPVTILGTAFPGDSALQDFSYEACVGEPFSQYVGSNYLDSALEVFTFTPTEESWDTGDRDVVCVLFKLDLTKLIGTARNSGL
jgi:hypothetical protein